jgi:hypothetical protein
MEKIKKYWWIAPVAVVAILIIRKTKSKKPNLK